LKIIFFANTDWYLYNFRRALASAARNAGHEVILVSPHGPYGAKLETMGFRWIAVPMERRSLNPLREIAVINWLRKLIRTEDVDLVHGFTIKSAVYGALAARFSGDRAVVSAVAGLGYVFTSRDRRAKLLRPLVRSVMRFAMGGKSARLILQNPDDVALFKEAEIVHPSRISLIRGSGVDCSRFSQCAVRAPGEPLRVLLAARLLWDKGLAEYVVAARILKASGRSVRFLLAGSPDPGNPNAVPEATVKAWAEEGLIEWLGHVDDMPALLASIHAMALPTAYGEGVPRSLIAAAACGLALVTTDAPGCREVVTNEVDGLLVPLRNAEALAAAIARFHDDPELAAKMGQAAKAKALREFDERIVIERTLAVYDELLRSDPAYQLTKVRAR
jgi:glycosyltransferase involved in cell wall biosynthesis